MTLKVTLDFSGIDLFWSIVDKLQSGTEPDQQLWRRLFDTPGYSALTKSEFSHEFFRKAITKAFKSTDEEETLDSNDPHSSFIRHFRECENRRLEVTSFLNGFKQRASNLDRLIVDEVQEYLPEGSLLEKLHVSFAFFQKDARGYDVVVVDPLLATELGELTDFLIAHEYHHQCRDALLCYQKENVDEEDKDIMWVLNQIQAEGIADHIDKPHWFYNHNPVDSYSDFVKEYRMEVKQGEETLNKIDRIIEEGRREGESTKEIGENVRAILPLSGHPIGYFMSNVISNAKLAREMIDCIGNPFEFFRLYNQAQRTVDNGGLSGKTLDLLTALEQEYC